MPRKVLEARIGLATAREQALRDAVPMYLANAVRDHDIHFHQISRTDQDAFAYRSQRRCKAALQRSFGLPQRRKVPLLLMLHLTQ